MTNVDVVAMDEFVASGRTGRRNALPDILETKNLAVGAAGLPYEMEKLNCSENDNKKSGQACADAQNQSESIETENAQGS